MSSNNKRRTYVRYLPTFELRMEKVEQTLIKFEQAPQVALALFSLPE